MGHPCPRGRSPGMQSSCSSGTAHIGPILMAIFIEQSSWLLVNCKDKIDVFILHFHSLMREPGAFQLPGSLQGVRLSLVSLNRSAARCQVYPSHYPSPPEEPRLLRVATKRSLSCARGGHFSRVTCTVLNPPLIDRWQQLHQRHRWSIPEPCGRSR